MRKRLSFSILFIILLMSLSALFACGKTESLKLSVDSVTLEAYDDFQISLPDGETDVTWSSSDESLATVNNGLISCLGKIGDVTITARSGQKEGKVAIHIINSDLSPRIVADDQTAFVNSVTDLSVKVRYNDNLYDNFTVTGITIDDASIAVAENGKIRGIAEGETTLNITVSWKGLTVRTRSSVNLKVLSEFSIIPEKEVYSVYNVNGSSKVVSASATIGADLYIRGEKIENPTITLKIKEGSEYLSVSGSTITAKAVDEPKSVIVTITAGSGDQKAETDITVNVYPDYVIKENKEFVTGSTSVVYEPAEGEIDGVSGANVYYTDKNCLGSGVDWVKWGHHLELQSLKTVSNVSQYDYIINELGYAFVSFDIYYDGQVNDSEVSEYRGVSINAQYGPNSSDSIYYIDCVKNVPERTLISDGKIINKLLPKTWTTVVIDFGKLTQGGWMDTYIHSCRVGDTTYIANIRYWYDDGILNGLDETDCDRDQRKLIIDDENANKYVAQENEFIDYSPAFTDFVKVEKDKDSYYSYSAKTSPYDENTKLMLDIRQQRKIYPYNVFRGDVVRTGFQYVSFEYRFVSGNPVLFVYDQLLQTNASISMKGVVDQRMVSVYSDGKLTNYIPENEWVSVLVAINPNLYSSDTIYLTSLNEGTEFDVRNVNYYKDDSGKYELGYNDLVEIVVENIDYGITDTEIDLSDILFVLYKGSLVYDYVIEDFQIEDGIATYKDGAITCNSAGTTNISFAVKYVDGEYSQKENFTITLSILERNTLILEQTDLMVYCGDEPEFSRLRSAEIVVERLIADGVAIEDISDVTASITEGEENVSLNGLTVTGLKEGNAVVKVTYHSEAGDVSALVNVTVHGGKIDSQWVVGTGNSQLSVTEENYGGRENVSVLRIDESGNIWDNASKLSVKESDHLGGTFTTPKEAGRNMMDNGYAYVAFDFCLPQGSGLFVCAPNGDVHSIILITANQAIAARGSYEPFDYYVYDEDGNSIVKNEKIPANKWCTLVIKYDYDPSGAGWACVQINLNNVNSVVYLDNLQCWYKNYLDRLIISAPQSVLGDYRSPSTAALPINIMKSGEEVLDAIVTVKVTDETVATYNDGVITFLKPEETTAVITAEQGNYKAEKTVRLLPYVKQSSSEAWSLFADPEANTFENGVLTLTTNFWNDYLVLRECDGYRGTNPDLTDTAQAIAHMKTSGYTTIVFTIKMIGGTAKIYAPTAAKTQAFISVTATGFTESNEEIKQYISLYDTDGKKLSVSDVLTSGERYTVVIKYNTEHTGWGEVAVKGATTTVELGDVYFYSE